MKEFYQMSLLFICFFSFNLCVYSQSESKTGTYVCFMPSVVTTLGSEMIVSAIPSSGNSSTIYNDGTARIDTMRPIASIGYIPNSTFVELKADNSYKIFFRNEKKYFELASGKYSLNTRDNKINLFNLPADIKLVDFTTSEISHVFKINVLNAKKEVHTAMLCEKLNEKGKAKLSQQQSNTGTSVQTTNSSKKIKQNLLAVFKRTANSPLVEIAQKEKSNDEFGRLSSAFGADETSIVKSRLDLAYGYYKSSMVSELENFDDVIGGLTFIVCYAYMIREGITVLSFEKVEKVYQQFEKILISNSALVNLSNNEKQLMLEKTIYDSYEIKYAHDTQNQIEVTCNNVLKKYLKEKAKTLKITDKGMEF